MIFRMHPSGLHTYNPEGEVFSFVTTVNGNKLHFTKQQIEGAKKAQTLYKSLNFPPEHDFKWILQSNQILNCPVTIPNITTLKGKTTRQTPFLVVLHIVWIPKEIRELHRNVTLSVEIFLLTVSLFLLLSAGIYDSLWLHI